MPRTPVTVTPTDRTGTLAQPAQQNSDTANNMSLAWNDGNVILELSSVTTTTVFTFPIPGLIDGQTVPSKTVTVAAGVTRIFGPLPPALYNQADGTVQINCDTANGRIRAYNF